MTAPSRHGRCAWYDPLPRADEPPGPPERNPPCPTHRSAGRTVVVTGGGTGIGRATALAFAEQGAAVLVTGRRKERLAETAAAHSAVVPVTADVTTESGAEAVAEAVRERGGTVDVLVHNA